MTGGAQTLAQDHNRWTGSTLDHKLPRQHDTNTAQHNGTTLNATICLKAKVMKVQHRQRGTSVSIITGASRAVQSDTAQRRRRRKKAWRHSLLSAG